MDLGSAVSADGELGLLLSVTVLTRHQLRCYLSAGCRRWRASLSTGAHGQVLKKLQLRESSAISGRIEIESLRRAELYGKMASCWVQVNRAAHRLLSTQDNGREEWLFPISSTIYLDVALFITIIKQRTQGIIHKTISLHVMPRAISWKCDY